MSAEEQAGSEAREAPSEEARASLDRGGSSRDYFTYCTPEVCDPTISPPPSACCCLLVAPPATLRSQPTLSTVLGWAGAVATTHVTQEHGSAAPAWQMGSG